MEAVMAAVSGKTCKMCGDPIAAVRLEMSPLTKTCSRACAAKNARALKEEAKKRYYQKNKSKYVTWKKESRERIKKGE